MAKKNKKILGFGERLRKTRENNNLTQGDFAKLVGCSGPVTISRFEKEDRTPSLEFLVNIATQFQVDLHWLITGEIINPQKRIEARFKENYSSLVKECKDANKIIQRLEAKRESGQPLTLEEENELRVAEGRIRVSVRMMENSLQIFAANQWR